MSEQQYRINGISFHYPKVERDVFHDVSFTLSAGQVLSVLGPNGAGKSTLLNCMAGLAHPQKGEITLAGKPLTTLSRAEIARSAAYVQQIHVPAFSYTVFQFVMMGRAPHLAFFARPGQRDEEIVRDALEQIGIGHLADKAYTEISGGERQQCVIARAIAQQPRVILFDEPAAHLDFGNQARILRLIRDMARQGYAIVMTTHNPDHALLLNDTVAVLSRDGTMTCGDTKTILTQETMQRLYGDCIRLAYVEALGREAALHETL